MQSLEQVENLKEFITWVKDAFAITEKEEKQISGCLFGTIINEIGHLEKSKIKEEILSVFGHWCKIITAKIDQLKEKGYFIQETPSHQLAAFLLTIFEGGALISKVYGNSWYVRSGLNHYCMYLRCYISPTYHNKIMEI